MQRLACLGVVPYSVAIYAAFTLAKRSPSLNTAWLVMHNLYWRHLREIADGVHHSSAMDRRRVSAAFCFQPGDLRYELKVLCEYHLVTL